jgi:hypothetical protein
LLSAAIIAWTACHLVTSFSSSVVLAFFSGDLRPCFTSTASKADCLAPAAPCPSLPTTYDNAANAELLRGHYQGLPGKRRAQGVNPEIPWLDGYKLDFCFR